MSSSGGSVTASLIAPLMLPAVAGKPLTTQGGSTLDDGSGNVSLPLGAALHIGGVNAGQTGEIYLGDGVFTKEFETAFIFNSTITALGYTGGSVNASPTTPALPANPPVSSTVYENTASGPVILIIPVTATAAGGSAQLALGSTSTPADWGGAEQIGVLGELHNATLFVPSGWHWSITTVSATIGTASILGL